MPVDPSGVPPAVTALDVETSPCPDQEEAQQPQDIPEATCSASTSSTTSPNLARYTLGEKCVLHVRYQYIYGKPIFNKLIYIQFNIYMYVIFFYIFSI